jgi:hypothetical protein
MKVKEATRAYEAFLRASLPVVEADLDYKHKQMSAAVFPFLRATFYRWAQIFREGCADLAQAPKLLAVGDLHVENFGTWRDSEGRLIWGVNDFDEAQEMPYTIDLVRLAASALLAAEEGRIPLSAEEACASLLAGYGEWLEKGGRPYVLEEEHDWLRVLATGALRDPVAFAAKMEKLKTAEPPKAVTELLTAHLPQGSRLKRFTTRRAGLGSLGRPRYVALAELAGGLVVREAKAMLPSAWTWSQGDAAAPLRCRDIAVKAVRCPDPCLEFEKGWVIRRLAPHCSRVEMTELPHRTDDLRLLRAMGREIANIHLGSPDAIPAVRDDLAKRSSKWLFHAATAMADATRKDWNDWRA